VPPCDEAACSWRRDGSSLGGHVSATLSNLTAIQLYDRLTTDSDALKVLAHDGTTMGGKKYGTGRSVALLPNRSCARARGNVLTEPHRAAFTLIGSR
jgi:hypothetical protein